MSRPKKKTKGHGELQPYKAYLFRDKDPVIDELRTIMQDTYGEDWSKKLGDVHRNGGPTWGCVHNWFYGKTRRPQSASIEAAGRALGMQRVWVKLKVKNGR